MPSDDLRAINRLARSTALAAALMGCAVGPAVSVGSTPPTSTPSTAATAPATSDYRRLEREILTELNAARSSPSAYSAHLSELLPLFNGTLLRRPGSSVAVRTTEGAAAVREAISALRNQAPVPTLTMNPSLSDAARELATDQSRTGSVGHTASDGSTPAVRINRHGTWGVSYSENVGYGAFMSGRDVVVDLIVDDGVPNRGHRTNIFDPSARVVGIACARHATYGSVCVIDQVGSYVGK